MNYLLAASRGGGLSLLANQRLDSKHIDEQLVAEVHPGATLSFLTNRATYLLPPPRRLHRQLHVYIMAGIPDITTKISLKAKFPFYTECILKDHPQEKIKQLQKL